MFRINGLEYHFDAGAGQKTGAFLDQRLNYAAAAGWAERLGKTGRALDVCTYQGGFALHLARVCEQVTGVDASRAALEVADRNLEINASLVRAETEWVEADAFELMRDWQDAGQRFDAIVLDPPAFAKTKRAAEGAMRGYKELNLRAIKMLGRTVKERAKPSSGAAGDLLLLLSRRVGGVPGSHSGSRCGCGQARAGAGDARGGAGSSGSGDPAGNQLSQVRRMQGRVTPVRSATASRSGIA